MRKILLLLPILILLFSIKSEAYTGPTGNNYEYKYTFVEGSATLEFYSDYLFFGVSQDNSSRPLLCACIPYTSSDVGNLEKYYVTQVVTGRYTWYMDTPNKKYPTSNFYYDQQWITWAELSYTGSQSTANWPVTWTSQIYQTANVPVFSTYQAGYNWAISEMMPQVDWEHPYYSVAIPTPEYDVTYRKVGLGVDVPLNFTFNAPLEGDYYVEIMAEFGLADYLTFMPVSRYFEASGYSYVTKEIVNPIQYVSPSDLTANTLHTVLTNMWQAALNEVPLSSVSIKFPTDFTAQEILDWREAYDELRSSCGMAGTSIKFYARYFIIEDDTKFIVGPWRIWNSYTPKTFTDELPSYYLPYAPASGNTGISTATSTDPDEVTIPVGGQTPTGEYYTPTFNINVGNNVPNYPDYPTIATYNLDNLLVSTMDNARGFTSFFGEFGRFLTDSFAFIPAWIWGIIGFGFSLSIVVMFLKIL